MMMMIIRISDDSKQNNLEVLPYSHIISEEQ